MKPTRCSIALLRVFGLAALFVMFAFAERSASAQDNSNVTGVVTDPSGGVVADVSVTLANPGIGYSQTRNTNSIGVYEFNNVPPAANYSLEFTKAGFATLTIANFTLNVGNKETRDAQLKIGDSKSTVEVTATPTETLNTTDATIGSNIDGGRIQDLPNSFVNNAANYLTLAPGVTPGGAVTGTRSDQTNITLDGIDVNDQRGGFAMLPSVNLPLDSIQELKVTTAGDDASYGHSAGGQMELVTKGGTNEFHGQAFEYNRVTAYTANDYFNGLNGVPNPQLIRNQFGGDVGGPIIKNKLYFFFSYNGLRSVAPEQNYLTVPVADIYDGKMNYVNGSGSVVATPASGPGSLAALDPKGVGADQDLLTYLQNRGYPLPNSTAVGDQINTSGYYFVSPVRNSDNTYVGRIDYQINPSHRLFARATWDRSVEGGFGGTPVQVLPGDPNPSASYIDHSRSWVVGETWNISPTMTNQASFGETNQVNAFAINNKPEFPNSLSFSTASLAPMFSAIRT